jgi:mannose/cellobiose epimerase-like protein (N-acyl-D-glucosamine 2-epimerase family)
LPLWATHGVDRDHGGFYEKLDFALEPVEEMRRARLVSRQIYSFATGHELGWTGPAEELVRHGLDFLLAHLIRADGTVIAACSADGRLINDRYDPCDYAFVLLALATAARQLADRDALLDLASRIRGRLIAGWAHPQCGFEEASQRELPLKANPQMHLFEAFLAWAELVGSTDPSWQATADGMAELALDKLINPQTGALPEEFDGDWNPMPDAHGLLIEPGHQFEWSWLLGRWACRTGRQNGFESARRLASIGEVHGIDLARGVAVNALNERFEIRDADAKLWPQAERIKAWRALGTHPMNSSSGRNEAQARLTSTIAGLNRYFVDAPAGLWHENMRPDGSFVVEPVRASSLYHLTCAIHALAEKPL